MSRKSSLRVYFSTRLKKILGEKEPPPSPPTKSNLCTRNETTMKSMSVLSALSNQTLSTYTHTKALSPAGRIYTHIILQQACF